MEFKDYYGILGVARTASNEDIRRAYRKLARKYHPDVSKEPDADARMREVNEANEVLGDAEKRAAYDQVLDGGHRQPPPGWERDFAFRGEQGGADEFSEFFSSLFGAGQAGSRAFRARGEDHHAVIDVDLDDALQGATREVSLRTVEADAQGRQQIRTRTLSVRIPPGVREGQQIRLAGQGMPGMGGGGNGDLLLEVRFLPHRLYRAEGRDLHMTLPVTPWEAALGASVRVPTPGGAVEITVPPGSVAGRKLRLKGRGLPGKPAGDLYLSLEVALPPADSERARELYEQMARELPFDPRRAAFGTV
ncbi:curved DNA-binding protein [Bordetella ansorpii]|uniref:Curved DNA-binding protein n=1 Tax=Bordetella ansorpii TaxID=288768 RepID=A0A146AZY3_9BORD|nr:DnaJ C-terminal domain-containing protein [Bordetella ansorpii]CZZ95286.1 curved DNA-binding protein [Bordetella ansorpii]